MNKWMEFSNEYAEVINSNLTAMNKFWHASMEQNSAYTSHGMEMFFEHMNKNVEFMHDFWNNTASTSEDLKKLYRENLEKFNTRYQKVYEEAMQSFECKAKAAE